MKRTILFVAILAFVTGCNASTSPNGTTTTEGAMTATVNGQAWSTVGVGSLIQSAHAIDSGGYITVVGVSSDLSGISLLLRKPIGGTMSLGISGSEGMYIPNTTHPTTGDYVTAGISQGTVTITKFDTVNRQISGSFSFTANNVDTLTKSVSVTNGTFLDISWSK